MYQTMEKVEETILHVNADEETFMGAVIAMISGYVHQHLKLEEGNDGASYSQMFTFYTTAKREINPLSLISPDDRPNAEWSQFRIELMACVSDNPNISLQLPGTTLSKENLQDIQINLQHELHLIEERIKEYE